MSSDELNKDLNFLLKFEQEVDAFAAAADNAFDNEMRARMSGISLQRILHVLDLATTEGDIYHTIARKFGVSAERVRDICAGEAKAIRAFMPPCPGCTPPVDATAHSCCPHQTCENGKCSCDHWWDTY